MVNSGWDDFLSELDRWDAAGVEVKFWWRDDDAGAPCEALNRLLRLSEEARVPLTLAVIPQNADKRAFRGTSADFAMIQHGVDHRNRAPVGEKKSEFPGIESAELAISRLVEARVKLGELAGDLLVPALAPPWNRLSPVLVPLLEAAGFCGLSRFGVRNITKKSPGFIEANTHADIIDWQGTRGFCGMDRALAQATRHLVARRTAKADPGEPTGWLSHHAVHDEACWEFLKRLFEVTSSREGVRWLRAGEVFEARTNS